MYQLISQEVENRELDDDTQIVLSFLFALEAKISDTSLVVKLPLFQCDWHRMQWNFKDGEREEKDMTWTETTKHQSGLRTRNSE